MAQFEKLFEPVQVGPLQLSNRIVMPPMCTRLATPDGYVTREMIDYYVERAKGGVGFVVVEYSYIDQEESKAAVSQLGAYHEKLLTGLRELVEAIHSQGPKVALQICHGGRQTIADRIGELTPVGPSPIPCKFLSTALGRTNPTRELSIEEVEKLVEAFGRAASLAVGAGFDGVEIHGAHGYLICEFLSPYTNKRNDLYGGDLEGRARFPLEVVAKVKQSVGPGMAVGYRLSGDEFVEGGLTLDETARFARMLEGAGVDYLHISAGIYESMQHMIQPTYLPHGYLARLAEGIKGVVNIPVITVGSYSEPEQAEQVLREGKTDLVSMGRALLADPELLRKVVEGRLEEIVPCIRCNDGCIDRFFKGWTVRCSTNAVCGRETRYARVGRAERPLKVVVVGGGPAGMEAARVAALRGHEVALYEKSGQLGGLLRAATVPDFKADLRRLVNYLSTQLNKLGVRVELNTEATPELVREAAPDVLIVATGSVPVRPDIPGIDKEKVVTALDVLLGEVEVGQKVAVAGGGLVGCEVAAYLAQQGKGVIIVEMLEDVALDMEPLSKAALLSLLAESGVEIIRGGCLDEVTDDGVVIIDKQWQRGSIEAEHVVLALGLQPTTETVEALKGLAPQVYSMGDCVQPGKVIDAIIGAFDKAVAI